MNKIKTKTAKIIAFLMSIVLICGGTGAIAYAAGSKSQNTSNSADSLSSGTTTASQEASTAAFDTSETASAPAKEETVYVIADADGNTREIIVSDWLQNAAAADSLSDLSTLTDIENVKGNETFDLLEDGSTLWAAAGNDIYYQGTSDKDLPVTVSIRYELDGVPIQAADLAGKSGHVTIHFDYTNNQTETVSIDGEDAKLYVPFVMVTGMILDNDVFSNVTLSDGKMINDGDRTIVLGLAFPGLSDDLQLDTDTIDLPDSFEINADVTDFTLATTMTLALNDVFSALDLSEADSLTDLSDSMNQITDAMNSLLTGSSDLYEGLVTALSGSSKLSESLALANDGANTLKNGSESAVAGAGTLVSGLHDLTSGLSSLSANNSALVEGAKSTFLALLSSANDSLASSGLDLPELTIDSYPVVLSQVIDSLSETSVYQTALDAVTQAVNANYDVINEQVTAAVREQVKAMVLASLGYTSDDYDMAVAAGLIDDTTQAQISGAIDAQMQTENAQATIQATTKQQISSLIDQTMQGEEVKAQLEAAAAGKESLEALLSQLNDYNTFYQGLITYTSGVASAYDGSVLLQEGSGQLSEGISQLSNGITSLSEGITAMSEGSTDLTDGLSQLTDGSKQLMDGLTAFNEEAVQKVTDAINGTSGNIISRLQGVLDAAALYNNYSGISDGMNGSVKFIYKTDSIQ